MLVRSRQTWCCHFAVCRSEFCFYFCFWFQVWLANQFVHSCLGLPSTAVLLGLALNCTFWLLLWFLYSALHQLWFQPPPLYLALSQMIALWNIILPSNGLLKCFNCFFLNWCGSKEVMTFSCLWLVYCFERGGHRLWWWGDDRPCAINTYLAVPFAVC